MYSFKLKVAMKTIETKYPYVYIDDITLHINSGIIFPWLKWKKTSDTDFYGKQLIMSVICMLIIGHFVW